MRKPILAISIALAATGVPAGAQTLEKELVVVAAGGQFERSLRSSFYQPFSEKTGVRVTAVPSTFGEQNAKVKAMGEMNAVTWDIVTSHPITTISMADDFLPIDCARIPNAARHGIPNACRRNSVVRTLGGGVLTYMTKEFGGRKPASWADFWDQKAFPGPRTLPNIGYPWEVLIPALLADGVPKDKLFPMDLDRAFKAMDRIKPHVTVWWKNADQAVNAFRSGDAVMGWLFDGRVLALKNEGMAIDMEFDGGIQYTSQWSILRKAPHPNAAYAFLDHFMAAPERHVAFTQVVQYGTSNKEALAMHAPAVSANLSANPRNWERMVDIDYDWLVGNTEQIIRRWNEWISR
ncbi:ABC transporter substrate-binding protein [Allostella vacuolata]|nr:ABC transporter substrate-binding protein [Stella vacuolata]